MVADPLLLSVPRGRVDVFDSNIPKFGNSVFFTVTDVRPNIRFNNMIKMIYVPAFYTVKIWFTNKKNGEQWELEWMFNYLLEYNDIPPYVSKVLGAHINALNADLDHNDISGKDWTSEVLIRRLSNREVEDFEKMGIEFDRCEEPVTTYDIEIHDVDDSEPNYELNPEKPNMKEAFEKRHIGRRFR